MDKRIKRMWIQALRSGEFKQGRGFLRDKYDNFSCLGVLAELYRRETDGGDWVPTEDIGWDGFNNCFAFVNDFDTQIEALTDNVAAWAGLSDVIGTFQASDSTLSSLLKENDGGKSFDEIADIIEENF